MDRMKVFTGSASTRLTEDICEHLGITMGKASIGRFPDGEISIKLLDDVRGCDVFVVQSTCPPVNDNLMELLILIDCARRASADRITAVIPYYGYARQDRKAEGRVPITAKLVANMIVAAGADRVLTIDLHSSQIQGFFDIPVDHLYATPVMGRYYRQMDISDLVVVCSDVGGLKMANAYAKMLKADFAVVEKLRIDPRTTKAGDVIGIVKDRNVLIIDDMITTGGSVAEACKALKDRGALDIYVGATHAVFCQGVVERLSPAPIKEIAVTDTIPLDDRIGRLKVRVLTVSRLLGETMRRIHFNESVSSLFSAGSEAMLF
jgi:ribose-phosphate pyrophosphokinase